MRNISPLSGLVVYYPDAGNLVVTKYFFRFCIPMDLNSRIIDYTLLHNFRRAHFASSYNQMDFGA